MKIATVVDWQRRQFTIPHERIRRCEQAGFDAVFVGEVACNDALTPLAYVAAITERIKLGTHVAAITARPPTVLAQGMLTIDAMAGGGRLIAGVGAGFPSTCEGWHGRPWQPPVRRMRDYVDVVRQVFRTAGAYDADGSPIETTELMAEPARAQLGAGVAFQGEEISIPYAGDGSLGVQPWVSALERGPEPPVLLAAVGPQMIQLAAEIADGWFPWCFAPGMMPAFLPMLEAGFERGGRRREEFDIWAHVDVLVSDDVEAGMARFRPYVVEWAANLKPQTEALGFAGLCDRLLELKAADRYEEALAAVPDEFVDTMFLVGSHQRIAQRLTPWLESGATGLVFRYGPQMQIGKHADLVEDMDVWGTLAKAAN